MLFRSITDPGEEGQESFRPAGGPTKTAILDSIKTTSTMIEPQPREGFDMERDVGSHGIGGGSVDSNRLKNMIASLKKEKY